MIWICLLSVCTETATIRSFDKDTRQTVRTYHKIYDKNSQRACHSINVDKSLIAVRFYDFIFYNLSDCTRKLL